MIGLWVIVGSVKGRQAMTEDKDMTKQMTERLEGLEDVIIKSEEEYADSFEKGKLLAPTRVHYLATVIRMVFANQMTEMLDIEAIENIILLYASEHPHRDWSIGIKGYDDVPMKKRRKENLEHWRACATAIRNHIVDVNKMVGED